VLRILFMQLIDIVFLNMGIDMTLIRFFLLSRHLHSVSNSIPQQIWNRIFGQFDLY